MFQGTHDGLGQPGLDRLGLGCKSVHRRRAQGGVGLGTEDLESYSLVGVAWVGGVDVRSMVGDGDLTQACVYEGLGV